MMTSSNGNIFRVSWPFVRGIHRSPVNSPHKGQWRGALLFSLICVRKNHWVNNREAGDLRRYRAHYDVIVMPSSSQECRSEPKLVVTVPAPLDQAMYCRLLGAMPLLNTLRRRQNDRHVAADISKCIILNENMWISIKISLKCVP